MERVERTIQKRLAGALLLFAGSCAIVVGAFMVLSSVAEGFRAGAGLNSTARWVLDARGWICTLALAATTTTLVSVVRTAPVRETNIFAATSLAVFNLLLVSGMFGLMLLGLRTPPSTGWPQARTDQVRPAPVALPGPVVLDPQRRLVRQEPRAEDRRSPGARVSR